MYLDGRVPPQFQEIDASPTVEGTNVRVLPSTVLSMFVTVTEIIQENHDDVGQAGT
jgi:hypothetical protein